MPAAMRAMKAMKSMEPQNMRKPMKAMKAMKAMKTMKAMKARKKTMKPMKAMKAMEDNVRWEDMPLIFVTAPVYGHHCLGRVMHQIADIFWVRFEGTPRDDHAQLLRSEFEYVQSVRRHP